MGYTPLRYTTYLQTVTIGASLISLWSCRAPQLCSALLFLGLRMGSIGVPLKLLHEAVGHVVTVEMKSGEVYRGKLVGAEDSMNIKLANIMFTARNGQTTELEHAFIRGSKLRLVVLPDILKNAPMFKRDPSKKLGSSVRGGIGRGRRN
jgi:small nuclear ribonucleoprotein D3